MQQKPFQGLHRIIKLHSGHIKAEHSLLDHWLDICQTVKYPIVLFERYTLPSFRIKLVQMTDLIFKDVLHDAGPRVKRFECGFVHGCNPIPCVVNVIKVILGLEIEICLEQKVPQGHFAPILIVVLRSLHCETEAILSPSLRPFLQSTLVQHFLPDTYCKLNVSYEEKLLYMPLVRLLPRHKAVPNMLDKLL